MSYSYSEAQNVSDAPERLRILSKEK